jgi:hypothetical protein
MRIRLIFSVLLVLQFTVPSAAQVANLQCSDNSSGPGNSVHITSVARDVNLLATPAAVQHYLNQMAAAALAQCKGNNAAFGVNRVFATVNLDDPNFPNDKINVLRGRIQFGSATWDIMVDTVPDVLSRKQSIENAQRRQRDRAAADAEAHTVATAEGAWSPPPSATRNDIESAMRAAMPAGASCVRQEAMSMCKAGSPASYAVYGCCDGMLSGMNDLLRIGLPPDPVDPTTQDRLVALVKLWGFSEAVVRTCIRTHSAFQVQGQKMMLACHQGMGIWEMVIVKNDAF